MLGGLLSKDSDQREFTQVLFQWIPVGNLHVDVGFLVDPLSITMAIFVTGIAALIHVYSIGYMHKDEHFSKFFVYMNLFVFSMLILVLGDNLVLTFVGWEGVGACSYFLISFWFTREEAAVAGKKAFVTNRVGDFGFMLGIFLTFSALGTVNYLVIDAKASTLAAVTATSIALAVLRGCGGQVRPAPTLDLVARRHGRPDAGLCADPRRDDGDRGRLPAVPSRARAERVEHRASTSSPSSARSPRSGRPRPRARSSTSSACSPIRR